jgi:hypothetical protein
MYGIFYGARVIDQQRPLITSVLIEVMIWRHYIENEIRSVIFDEGPGSHVINLLLQMNNLNGSVR